MNEQFEQRLSAIEYELSQIAESEYLEELKEKFSGDYGKDVVVNIIPSRDISFKTRSLLSSILDRLELNHQDRLDLEKYIVYGGGDNIEYLKQTLAIWVEWKDKVLNVIKDAPEEFDSLIEIFNYINNHIIESNIKLEEIEDKLNEIDTFNSNGIFPNLTAGELVGRGESVPAEFGFRASGGKSIKDGRAYIKRIKGNSVVWNNMVDTRGYEGGFFADIPFDIIQGHKYLLQRTHADDGLYLIPIINGEEKYDMSLRNGVYAAITESPYTGDSTRVFAEAYCGACVISDLTKMFGEGNEPNTIEEYEARKPIVEDEYAYNEGQVIHCNTESIKSVGDNAWDEEWEVGKININDGSNINTTTEIRSKNYSKVLPSTEYYIETPNTIWIAFLEYDADKNFLRNRGGFYGKITTSPDCHYLRFYTSEAYGTTYNHDIMITLVHSGWKQDTDAGYQPYWQDTLPLPIINKYFPQGMKSAGTAHDEIRFNKTTKKWEYSKGKIKSVDLGDLTWETPWYNDNGGWRIYAQLQDKPFGLSNILNKRYANAGVGDGEMSDNSITGNDNSDYIYIKDSSFSAEGVDALIASLQGVILYYESNDWEWVGLDAEDQNFRDYYNVADFGTEQSQSNVPSAPFSADIIYQFNAVDMIREHEIEITELQNIIKTMQAQLVSLTSNY